MSTANVNEELCGEYQQLTEAKSVKNTGMWLGSHEVEEQCVHIVDGDKMVSSQLSYPPSLVQIFMEQVANLLDQRNKHPDMVNTFRFSFDKKTGTTSMYNNGPSIPVDIVRDKDGKSIWLPEMLCTRFLSGSNHNKSEGHRRISLGAHGIGLKAMTSMSLKMCIECVDVERKKYYKQTIGDCNTKIEPPVVEKIGRNTPSEIRKGGTRFTYDLDYGHYKKLPNDIFETLDQIYRAKVYQVSAYSGINVFYNDTKIPVKTAKQLAAMYFGEKPIYFELDHPEWGLSISVGPCETFGKGERLSIINGGSIGAGVHFDYVLDHIATDMRTRVEKMLKDKVTWRKTHVTNSLSILIIGTIPDLVFNAQIKDSLKMKDDKKYMSQYIWPSTYATKIWKVVEAQLGVQYIVNSKPKEKTRRAVTDDDKYFPAYKLKTAKSDLLRFEGDSAAGSALSAMADKNVKNFDRTYKGVSLIGGCPINVLKNLSEKKFKGVTHSEPSKKLMENVGWNDFMTIMNLRYGMKYDTDEAFATLNYRRVTLLVDKDLHGMGKIAAIEISNIYYFWPELIDRPDFIGFMDSPVIRAFPNNKKLKVKHFPSQNAFDEWRTTTFDDGIVKGWTVQWYKGLGTHSNKECCHMYSEYEATRIAYTDEQKVAAIMFAAYFGKDADMRKKLLCELPTPLPDSDATGKVTIKDMLDYYTREEQRYNLMCKLNHQIDNQILSHRRILAGLIRYMDTEGNKKLKVYQLAGFIAQKMGYHHGDASLCGAITWLAQDFVGARNIPMCLPLSQFGDRFGNSAAAPRYIDTQANSRIINAIYPAPDRELYDLIVEDGKKTIPTHFVPVVCMPILETNVLPGTGWKISKWARDYHEHVENIHRMMDGKHALPMKPWAPHHHGRVVTIDGVEWSVGNCMYDKQSNMVTITELPFQTANNPYIYGNVKARKKAKTKGEQKTYECLYDRELIVHSSIKDNSTRTDINITFKLTPGAIDKINECCGDENFTPLEEYLYLKKNMKAHLNFMDDNGNVVEFRSYEAVMVPWFMERYKLYPIRIERQKIIIRLKIKMREYKMQYIKTHAKLKLKGKKLTEQDATLESNGYPKFNMARLSKPDVPNGEIESVVHGSGATYKYLLLNHADMSDEAIVKLQTQIDELKRELEELSCNDIVKKTWKAEIAEVTRCVDDGIANGWVTDDDHNF